MRGEGCYFLVSVGLSLVFTGLIEKCGTNRESVTAADLPNKWRLVTQSRGPKLSVSDTALKDELSVATVRFRRT
eukprot:SAG31_NODE_11_length_38734_cov_21.263854_26_plen_74_part_00